MYRQLIFPIFSALLKTVLQIRILPKDLIKSNCLLSPLLETRSSQQRRATPLGAAVPSAKRETREFQSIKELNGILSEFIFYNSPFYLFLICFYFPLLPPLLQIPAEPPPAAVGHGAQQQLCGALQPPAVFFCIYFIYFKLNKLKNKVAQNTRKKDT